MQFKAKKEFLQHRHQVCQSGFDQSGKVGNLYPYSRTIHSKQLRNSNQTIHVHANAYVHTYVHTGGTERATSNANPLACEIKTRRKKTTQKCFANSKIHRLLSSFPTWMYHIPTFQLPSSNTHQHVYYAYECELHKLSGACHGAKVKRVATSHNNRALERCTKCTSATTLHMHHILHYLEHVRTSSLVAHALPLTIDLQGKYTAHVADIQGDSSLT